MPVGAESSSAVTWLGGGSRDSWGAASSSGSAAGHALTFPDCSHSAAQSIWREAKCFKPSFSLLSTTTKPTDREASATQLMHKSNKCSTGLKQQQQQQINPPPHQNCNKNIWSDTLFIWCSCNTSQITTQVNTAGKKCKYGETHTYVHTYAHHSQIKKNKGV